MARIKWHGTEFAAEFVRDLPNGNKIYRALDHGARFTVGTEIEVKPNEIISRDVVTPAADSGAALQRAMDEERKTLPPVSELLAAAKTS